MTALTWPVSVVSFAVSSKDDMLRSLYLSPVFSGASEIDSIRCAQDPLASKIRPHITLVFPFESSLGGEELAAHAAEAASAVGGFWISLGRAQTRGNYIWLPVMQGRDAVVSLHDTLYRGVLGLHLDSNRPYDPHVTIARVEGSDLNRVYEAAMALRGPFEAYVDQFFIELIMPDESSNVERVIEFKKKEPNLAIERTRPTGSGCNHVVSRAGSPAAAGLRR